MEVVAAWGRVSRPFVFVHSSRTYYLFLPDAPTWDIAQTAVEAILQEPGLRGMDPDMIRRLAWSAWEDPERVGATVVVH